VPLLAKAKEMTTAARKLSDDIAEAEVTTRRDPMLMIRKNAHASLPNECRSQRTLTITKNKSLKRKELMKLLKRNLKPKNKLWRYAFSIRC